MVVDKRYCMSSFLMFRSLLTDKKTFKEGITPSIANIDFSRESMSSSKELDLFLKEEVNLATKDGKAAIMLSGGIDSAILAKYMPKGSTAYTLKCVVPGVQVVDETEIAAKYAEECGLNHKIIEVTWEDYMELINPLMIQKGAPIHSIEPQLYKAALRAKKDGFTKLIFGEAADIIYGGFDQLLSKDWLIGEFTDRYTHVLPYKVLKDSELILEPFIKHEKNGYVDPHEFMNDVFRLESTGSYLNACSLAEIEFIGPFSKTVMADNIDYNRIRNGENKYLVREVFSKHYSNFKVPAKIPMPRPVNEWLKNWQGPTRKEFWYNSTLNMTGDQKWLVFILERYLNILEEV